jgi:hypothetical protein
LAGYGDLAVERLLSGMVVRRSPSAADDSGELAAAALDGLIEDWSVMSYERWQASG